MSVITCTYFSKARKGRVTFHAVLPTELPQGPSIQNDNREAYAAGPFKTIYLLHGYTGGFDDWLIHSPIEQWAMKYRYAVIMPGASNDFYLDNEDTEEKHGEWIGQELIDVTRKMFPLSHKREETILGGFSMGGYGAVRNGLKYN
jgi:S-formylglutathione hydrolase FrmB